jgi:tetratricopeptide (TPR) repeat protein
VSRTVSASLVLLGLLSLGPVPALSGPGSALGGTAAGAGDEVETLHAEGVSLYERGEFRRALDRFEAALRLAPDERVIRINLGRTCVAIASQLLEGPEGEDPRALEHAGRMLQRGLLHWEGDALTHELLALCALRRGRLSEAERALEDAVARAPESKRAWRQLGIVRDRRGDLAGAIEALERAVALSGPSDELQRRLRRVRHDQETVRDGRPLQSRRFRVFVPPSIPLEQGREVLALLDRTSEDLERRWGGDPPAGVEVILYPPGEFSRRTGLSEEVGGAFDGRIRIAFPAELEEGGLELGQVVRHEVAHLALHDLPVGLPRWLDEGLAQLADGGDRSDWLARFQEAGGARADRGILEREAAVRPRKDTTPSSSAWGGLYRHSYLLLRSLEETHGAFRLDLAVRRIRRGKSPEAAFEEVFGATPVELDRRWRAALRGSPPESPERGGVPGSGEVQEEGGRRR